MTPLPPDEVHLWYASPDDVAPEALEFCRRWLAPDELERWRRFHFDRDRTEYLVAHALLRWVLSRYANVSPSQWQFVAGDLGKPELAGPRIPLRFNLSHTQRLVAVGVTVAGEIGVDVERIERMAGPDLASAVLAPAELAQLPPSHDPDWARAFFGFWTLKEAYLKARGVGLSCPLHDFAFTIAPGAPPRIAFSARGLDSSANWVFWQESPFNSHCAAIAVRADVDRAVTLKLRVQSTDFNDFYSITR